MCLTRVREYYSMQVKRKLVPVDIVETSKRRGEPVDVRSFFKYTPDLNDIVVACGGKPADLLHWVHNHIEYRGETDDYWNYPEETLRDSKGDCEDGAILLANLLAQAGFSYDKILLSVYGKHVVVVFDGKMYDWTKVGDIFVPPDESLWYCWNSKRAYTTKEHVEEWS